MGYFSELDLTNRENYIDRSYHGFEEQLLWRYEDLKERYSSLSREGAPINGDDQYRHTSTKKEGYRKVTFFVYKKHAPRGARAENLLFALINPKIQWY